VDVLDFSQADSYTAARRVAEKAGVKVDLSSGTASTYYLAASDWVWPEANGQIKISTIENAIGTTQSDLIKGDANDNLLEGRLGSDVLTGGAGGDIFSFRDLSSDTITDFNVVDDTIQLDHAVFSALAVGAVNAANFVTGTAAVDSNDYLIYNTSTGALFYDLDGSGSAAAVQIALLGSNPGLTNGDFMVV
jgi:Ca2+-binding RTX toxin-like protein